MKQRVTAVLLGAMALATGSAFGQAQAQQRQLPRDFRLEDSHSLVTFSIGFLGFPVRGRFDEVRGTIAHVSGDVTASSLSVAIPVKSISTGSEHRDGHLRSSDFFDAEKFPYIVFQSRTVTRSGNGYVVTGPLTMHGVTRTVSIPFREVHASIEEPHGSTLILYSGTARLNRKDFGIMGGSKFNNWFDDVRSATMGDSVDIALDVQGWDPDYTRNKQQDRALARIDREGMDSLVTSLRARRAQDANALKDAEWELSQIARALLVRGKSGDAVKLLRFNRELFPTSSGAHCALASALESLGQRAEAKTLARRALELDPYDTWAMELIRRL